MHPPSELNRINLRAWAPAMIALIVLSFEACGARPASSNSLPSDAVEVTGAVAAWGSQCPYGSVNNSRATALKLQSCPISKRTLEIQSGPTPLIVMADCKEMTLAIRSADRTLDSLWEVAPDGRFSSTIQGGPILIKSLGPNGSSCVSFTEAQISGRMDCTDRDRAKVSLSTQWILGKGLKTQGVFGVECQLPEGCALGTETQIQQCP